jgi:hypothetical protein
VSVFISKDKEAELSRVVLHFKHPLTTLREKTDDDVLYICFPKEMLKDYIETLQGSLERGEGQNTLFTADIELRPGVVIR